MQRYIFSINFPSILKKNCSDVLDLQIYVHKKYEGTSKRSILFNLNYYTYDRTENQFRESESECEHSES